MNFRSIRKTLGDLGKHDSVLWRRAINAGVSRGPGALVKYSPPVFGLVFYAALHEKRRFVAETLRRALGERGQLREAVDVARVFMTYASCLTDAFVTGSDRGEEIVGRSTGDRHFLKAASKGRGVILVSAHTGGWQSAPRILRNVHGAEVLVVMRRERDQAAQDISDTVRDRTGMRVLHVGDDPMDALGLLHHLRKGGVVAIQIDRLPQGMRGRKGLLFGHPFELPEGPLRLAAVSGAPIVPVFTRRLGYMEYEVLIAPSVDISRRPTEAELDRAAAALLSEMERFVLANPTQWFHFAG